MKRPTWQNRMNQPSRGILAPYVRHMLLCERATATTENVTLHRLFTKIERRGQPFPYSGGFSVCLILTEGRKSGFARIRIVATDDDELCYEGQAFPLVFDGDPLKTYVFAFRITRCTFPRPALYMVEFVFEGLAVAHEPLLVR